MVLHGTSEYLIHIRNLKQALNNGFILTKVHRVIKFNQKVILTWILSWDKKQKKIKKIEKYFFKLMSNAAFEKILENEKKNRKEKKPFSIRTKLSYYKIFLRQFISNRNKKLKY